MRLKSEVIEEEEREEKKGEETREIEGNGQEEQRSKGVQC